MRRTTCLTEHNCAQQLQDVPGKFLEKTQCWSHMLAVSKPKNLSHQAGLCKTASRLYKQHMLSNPSGCMQKHVQVRMQHIISSCSACWLQAICRTESRIGKQPQPQSNSSALSREPAVHAYLVSIPHRKHIMWQHNAASFLARLGLQYGHLQHANICNPAKNRSTSCSHLHRPVL